VRTEVVPDFRWGCTPPAANTPVSESPPRAVALDNARAGCLRELFGAMVAHVQCERAGDFAQRAAFAAIARDEAAHAALAFDLRTRKASSKRYR
jgi:hypothetical protein